MVRPRQPTPDASVRRPVGRRAQLKPDMTPRTTTAGDGAYVQRLGCAHFAHLRAVFEDLSPTRPHSTTWPQSRRPTETTAALGESRHPVPNRERPRSAFTRHWQLEGRSMRPATAIHSALHFTRLRPSARSPISRAVGCPNRLATAARIAMPMEPQSRRSVCVREADL